MTTTPLPVDDVWVMTLRPMVRFHGVRHRRTRCGIPLMGFGFRRSLFEVRDDLCRPCPRCFPRRLFNYRLLGNEEEA